MVCAQYPYGKLVKRGEGAPMILCGLWSTGSKLLAPTFPLSVSSYCITFRTCILLGGIMSFTMLLLIVHDIVLFSLSYTAYTCLSPVKEYIWALALNSHQQYS